MPKGSEVEEFVKKEIALKEKYKPFTLVSYVLVSIYLLVVGLIALYIAQGIITWPTFVAVTFILGAIFVAVYGGLQILHVSFVKKNL